jgi:hypothetical protein
MTRKKTDRDREDGQGGNDEENTFGGGGGGFEE